MRSSGVRKFVLDDVPGAQLVKAGADQADIRVRARLLARVRLFVPPGTVSLHRAPHVRILQSKHTGVELPFLHQSLPDPGIKPTPSALQVDSLLLSHQEAQKYLYS